MKRPTFLQGVIVALAFGFFSSAVFAALLPFVGTAALLRLVIPALALCYVLYLFTRTPHRTGRLTTLTAWAALAGIVWYTAPPLPLYVLIHVGAVWLIRSLYFYSSLVAALMDLGLSALGTATAVWAATRSGSFFLAVWCFFLIQALFTAIPTAGGRKHRDSRSHSDSQGRFRRACDRADAALRQLADGQ